MLEKNSNEITRIGISLNKDTINVLNDLCKDYGLNRSAMISFIVNQFFYTHEKNKENSCSN